MERQEKYCQEQQQANQADTPGSAGSGRKYSHQALNTQVCLLCQSEVSSGAGKLSEQGHV